MFSVHVFSLFWHLAKDDDDLGHKNIMKHQTKTGMAKPFHLPLPHRDKVHELLLGMLQRNMLWRNNCCFIIYKSPWASPIVLVKKTDGIIYFYVDYHKVNDVTKKDAHIPDSKS